MCPCALLKLKQNKFHQNQYQKLLTSRKKKQERWFQATSLRKPSQKSQNNQRSSIKKRFPSIGNKNKLDLESNAKMENFFFRWRSNTKLQSFSKYFETYWCFTKVSFHYTKVFFHHKWNDARLLLINSV